MGGTTVIIDSDILLVLLNVPGYEQAGPDNDRWDSTRIMRQIKEFEKQGSDFVISIAGLIEVGNRITNNKQDMQVFVTAKRLSELIRKAVNDDDPWTAFRAQATLLEDKSLLAIAEAFPEKARSKISMGDLIALKLVEYYRNLGSQVYLWTGDQGLQEQEAPEPAAIPRRNK